MGLIEIILFPFTIIYDLITRLRNHLFDIGYTRSFQFQVRTISVGNLSVGGTGKTPMIEYLIRLLKDQHQVVTLSRGYGRKTRGFLVADENVDASKIGDEPFQFYNKFKDDIQVAVGEERALAIPEILFRWPDTDVILLDDAYQHRTVKRDLNILLSDLRRPFYDDHVLPSGRLRERRMGAKRADILIITKCPDDLDEASMFKIEQQALPYLNQDVPVLFAGIKYHHPQPVWSDLDHTWGEHVFLVTGIAKPAYLVDQVKSNYHLISHKSFSDHHHFSEKEIGDLIEEFKKQGNPGGVMLTTEKDAVKLRQPAFKSLFRDVPLFYLPITPYFLKNGHIFAAKVEQTISDAGQHEDQ